MPTKAQGSPNVELQTDGLLARVWQVFGDFLPGYPGIYPDFPEHPYPSPRGPVGVYNPGCVSTIEERQRILPW